MREIYERTPEIRCSPVVKQIVSREGSRARWGFDIGISVSGPRSHCYASADFGARDLRGPPVAACERGRVVLARGG
jgi:hypothetical protein